MGDPSLPQTRSPQRDPAARAVPVPNLLAGLPERLPDEQLDELIRGREFRVERIISTGQSTPSGHWYDQDEAEWVLLLCGAARLRIEHEPHEHELHPGDYVHLPAHCRHRVEWTDPTQPTVWL